MKFWASQRNTIRIFNCLCEGLESGHAASVPPWLHPPLHHHALQLPVPACKQPAVHFQFLHSVPDSWGRQEEGGCLLSVLAEKWFHRGVPVHSSLIGHGFENFLKRSSLRMCHASNP